MSGKKVAPFIIVMILLVFVSLGCDSEQDPQVNHEVVLYEESEIALPVDFEVVSVKQIETDRYIISYTQPEDRSFRLAYTDSTFTKVTPILNEAGALVHFKDVINQEDPYAFKSIGNDLLYDIDSLGNIYVVHYETIEVQGHPNPGGAIAIYQYDEEGVLLEQIAVEESNTDGFALRPTSIYVGEHTILLASDTGTKIVNKTGELVQELSTQLGDISIGRIIDLQPLDDERIVFVHAKNLKHFLTAYNTTTGEVIWERQMDEQFRAVHVTIDVKAESIVVVSANRMMAFDLNGEKIGEMIDFNDYSIGFNLADSFHQKDALRPQQVIFNDGNIELYLTSPTHESIQKIVSFRRLSAEEAEHRLAEIAAENVSKKTITIVVPYVESNMEQIIAEYERLNRNVKINLLPFRDGIDDYNYEDMLQFISMQVLTDDAAWDIISTQWLPYTDYIKSGYFADLEQIEYANWEREKAQFFANLLEATKIDGKLYIFPTRISFWLNFTASPQADRLAADRYTWADMIELSKQKKEEEANVLTWDFPIWGDGTSLVLASFQNDMVDTQDEPDKQADVITEFLETLKYVNTADEYADSTDQDQEPLFMHEFYNPVMFRNWIDMLGGERHLLPHPHSPLQGKSSFTIQEAYAINSKSEVQADALQFILYLAEHVTPDNVLLKHSIQNLENHLLESKSRTYPPIMSSEEQIGEIMQTLQQIVENLNDVQILDTRITDAIMTTAEQYVNDIVDLETAVKTIQEKLWLYANE